MREHKKRLAKADQNAKATRWDRRHDGHVALAGLYRQRRESDDWTFANKERGELHQCEEVSSYLAGTANGMCRCTQPCASDQPLCSPRVENRDVVSELITRGEDETHSQCSPQRKKQMPQLGKKMGEEEEEEEEDVGAWEEELRTGDSGLRTQDSGDPAAGALWACGPVGLGPVNLWACEPGSLGACELVGLWA
jgi:hypothetical protein